MNVYDDQIPFYIKNSQEQIAQLTTTLLALQEQFDEYVDGLDTMYTSLEASVGYDEDDDEASRGDVENKIKQYITQHAEYFTQKLAEYHDYFANLSLVINNTSDAINIQYDTPGGSEGDGGFAMIGGETSGGGGGAAGQNAYHITLLQHALNNQAQQLTTITHHIQLNLANIAENCMLNLGSGEDGDLYEHNQTNYTPTSQHSTTPQSINNNGITVSFPAPSTTPARHTSQNYHTMQNNYYLPVFDLNFISPTPPDEANDPNMTLSNLNSPIKPQTTTAAITKGPNNKPQYATIKASLQHEKGLATKAKAVTSSAVQQTIQSSLQRAHQGMAENVHKGGVAHEELVMSSEILALVDQDAQRTRQKTEESAALTRKYELKVLFNKNIVRWTFLFFMLVCFVVVSRRLLWFATPIVYAHRLTVKTASMSYGVVRRFLGLFGFIFSLLGGHAPDHIVDEL